MRDICVMCDMNLMSLQVLMVNLVGNVEIEVLLVVNMFLVVKIHILVEVLLLIILLM